MEQKSYQSFESSCGQAKVFVESNMPIGKFHDFLMELKGNMVDRMIVAHNQQVEQMQAQKQLDPEMQQPCEGSCVPAEV